MEPYINNLDQHSQISILRSVESWRAAGASEFPNDKSTALINIKTFFLTFSNFDDDDDISF